MTPLTTSDLRAANPVRYVLPVVTMVLPVLLYFGIATLVFTGMTPAAGRVGFAFLSGEDATALGKLGADLSARYAFGIATSAFIASALAALALVFWRLSGRWGLWPAVAAIVAVTLAGAVYSVTPFHPIRALVSETAFDRVIALKLTDPPTTPQHILGLVRFSQAVGVAAVCALVLRFADLAFEPTVASQTDESLRRRMNGFRHALLAGGLLLAFAVASAHAFYHYPASLMTAEAAKDFRVLASTASTFWGAIYSGVLLVVALPCYAAIAGDASAVSASKGGDSHAAREEWLQQEGLTLAPRQAFMSLLATAAPLLTGPFLDLIRVVPL